MPSQNEIKEALNFAADIFDRVCKILDMRLLNNWDIVALNLFQGLIIY